MPAVHGFVAGWAVDPFSIIIFTVLAPAMPSAAWGWAPGLLFGLGTACVQAVAGALFGRWAAGRGLSGQAAQRIAADLDADALAAILIALPFGLQLYALLRQQPQNRAQWLETLGKLLDRGVREKTKAAENTENTES